MTGYCSGVHDNVIGTPGVWVPEAEKKEETESGEATSTEESTEEADADSSADASADAGNTATDSVQETPAEE